MDGNRRFAKRLSLSPFKGHSYGAKKIEDVLHWCKEAEIRELTLYALSLENINSRPKEELDYLFNLFKEEFLNLKNKLPELNKNGLRIRFIGRRDLFSKDLQELMATLEQSTIKNNQFYLNFAMPYGGRNEIIFAVKSIVKEIKSGALDVEKIDEIEFSKHLWLNSDPDLIIRTSGEKRLSGFLLWQSAYSELCFIDKFWPELEKDDFFNVIKEFETRVRRFGS